MAPDVRTISHADLLGALRRVGYPMATIEEIAAQLSDPIDLDRDADILARYGVTRGHLTDLMGASP
jgi:hypothetical protein